MKKISKFVVGVFCALLLATSAFAADTAVKASTNAPVAVTTTPAPASDWVMTIGGAGATTTTGDSQTAFGVDFSVGRTLNLIKGFPEEVGIRQSFGYASSTPQSACSTGGDDGGTFLASTRAYLDVTVLTFNLTKTTPVDIYVGGNIGPNYGNTTLKWVAAPEVGLDVWLAKNVALDARLEYAFDLNNSRAFDALTYFLGVKFKF